MELLLRIVLGNLRAFQVVGYAVFTVAVWAILLGWRLEKGLGRAERLGNRAGVQVHLPDLDQFLPWWLAVFVPETALGFAAWVFVGTLGIVLALAAKRTRRMLG